MVKIIYEDKDIIVAEKPVGIESQSSRRFEPDMVSEIKKHLSIHLSTKLSTNSSTTIPTPQKAAEPYVGVIHRLDKPVGGIMVYAKSQKAAASLSKQVQDGRMKKIYEAVVCGKLVDNVGNYVDYLLKDGKNNYSQVVDNKVSDNKVSDKKVTGKKVTDCKRAELNFLLLDTTEEEEPLSLVQVELLTGRHHQIRVQFAAHGFPLWGDNKYNPRWGGTLPVKEGGAAKESGTAREACQKPRAGSLALWAVRLSFNHPTTGKVMEFSMEPQGEAFRLF